MTLEELRDWRAKQDGWVWTHHKVAPCSYWWNERLQQQRVQKDHPYPATIDGAASAMPEGWTWSRGFGMPVGGVTVFKWFAWQDEKPGSMYVECKDTGDECFDRYMLAKLCIEAMKGGA